MTGRTGLCLENVSFAFHIDQKADKTKNPVRLAIYDGNKLLGYKADSGWALAEPKQKLFKTHPLKDAKPEGHLAKNLLYCFNDTDPVSSK
ncbi:MAG: hypothetical protein PHX96_04900, partial [Candidatus Nanoarchaeia archaeon]|nr:hypothetical protein [Candidatus Nanoarchaeia archaeon]